MSSTRTTRLPHRRNEHGTHYSRQSRTVSLDSQSMMDRQAIFQQFGGFAIYEPPSSHSHQDDKDAENSDGEGTTEQKNGSRGRGETAAAASTITTTSSSSTATAAVASDANVLVHEILVPFPAGALRRSEEENVIVRVHTLPGLPWPSYCTQQVQRTSGVARPVPLLFRGLRPQPEWFSWIPPGAVFVLENGAEWTPAVDGAFLFWFDENLEPTEYDRYFPLASLHALSVQDKVSRTAPLDYTFRKHLLFAEEVTPQSALGANLSSYSVTSLNHYGDIGDSPLMTAAASPRVASKAGGVQSSPHPGGNSSSSSSPVALVSSSHAESASPTHDPSSPRWMCVRRPMPACERVGRGGSSRLSRTIDAAAAAALPRYRR